MYGLLGSVQSATGFVLLWRIPSETAGGVLFGLSLERFTLLGGMLLFGLIFLALAVGAWQNSRWMGWVGEKWHTHLHQPKIWGTWVSACLLLLISGCFFTLITPEITEPFAAAYFLRLQPLALLMAGLAGQTLIALPFIRFGPTWRQTLRENPEWARVAILYGVFLLLAGGLQRYLSLTGPDAVGWNTLGTPLLDTQVGLVFLLGFLLVWGGTLWKAPAEGTRPARWKLDALIFVFLWIAAAWYWHALPLSNNWYLSAPRYPTFSYYPNSDGVVYDTTAQSLLSGMGYKSSHLPYPRRPLYDLFVFGLYLIKGQDFEGVVALQSMLLAVFPALVYLMTKNMHTRLAGIIAGVLVLLREGNAMALTQVITASHSKMVMSDVPTAVGVVLFAWVAFRWLTADRTPVPGTTVSGMAASKRLGLILIAGGILAAWMHIRIETGVFIPVVFGLALLQRPRLKTRYLTSLFAFLGCMMLVLSPWIVRNWKMTGLVFLETPDNRLSFLTGRLQQTTEDDLPQAPPEEPESTPRPKTRPPTATAQTDQPGLVQVLFQHAMHSLSQAILLFPNTYRIFDSTIGYLGHKDPATFWAQCCSGHDYVKRLPYWEWGKWSGEIPPQAVIPNLINLLILTIGFRQTWRKHRWNSLLPVGLALAYYGANGLARTSGGRYLLPVDWVWIAYYSIGMAHLLAGGYRMFGANPQSFLLEAAVETPPSSATPARPWQIYTAISLSFFLLGVSLPAAETIFPPRYTEATLNTWFAEFIEADTQQILAPHLQEFFAQGGAVLQGQGSYLRYYGADQGEPGSQYPAVYPRPFPRLNLFLVGPTGLGVSLPLGGRPDIRAENAADVLVLGCVQPDTKASYFDALAIFYPSTGEIFVREPFPSVFACPFSEP